MTVKGINALANKELKSNLKAMLTALETGKKATWQYAFAVRNIVEKESFKQDFETLKGFADYVNMTKGSISQMVNAVKFVERENLVPVKKDGKPDFAGISITVSNAYILSVLSEEDFEDFVEYCEDKEIPVYALSQNTLKSVIKEWRESKETTEEDSTEESTEDSTEESTEDSTEESTEDSTYRVAVDTKEKALTAIACLMERFNITLDEVKEQIK